MRFVWWQRFGPTDGLLSLLFIVPPTLPPLSPGGRGRGRRTTNPSPLYLCDIRTTRWHGLMVYVRKLCLSWQDINSFQTWTNSNLKQREWGVGVGVVVGSTHYSGNLRERKSCSRGLLMKAAVDFGGASSFLIWASGRFFGFASYLPTLDYLLLILIEWAGICYLRWGNWW